MKQIINTTVQLFLPGYGVYESLGKVEGHGKCSVYGLAFLCQSLWLIWIALQFSEIGMEFSGSMSWVAFVFMISIIGYTRAVLRAKYNVWGSLGEDMWLSLMMYPFVLNQTTLMVLNDGEGAPDYFTDVIRNLEMVASLKGGEGKPAASGDVKMVEVSSA